MLGISFVSLVSFLSASLFATTIQTNICQPVTSPVFSTQDNTTASATEVIAGSTSPSISVAINNNSQQVATITSDSSGNFSLQVSLNVGSNKLTAIGMNDCGSVTSPTPLVITMTAPPVTTALPATSSNNPTTPSTSSKTVPVVTARPTNAPQITAPETVITAPSTVGKPHVLPLTVILPSGAKITKRGEGATALTIVTTSDKSVFLKGLTEASAAIIISNNSLTVAQLIAAPDGSFGFSIPLRTGTNVIIIEASLAGNVTTLTLTYIRNPPTNPWIVVSSIVGIILVATLGLTLIVKTRIRLR